MLDGFGCGSFALFQHFLDQINPSPGTIELVAEQYIGGTGCRAKSAMHTGAQNSIGVGDFRIGELLRGEMCLHQTTPYMRPGFSFASGSKACLIRALKERTPGDWGWNTGTTARTASGALNRNA